MELQDRDDNDHQEQHDRSGWPVLRSRFAEVIAGRDRDDWAARFEGIDACVAPVLDMVREVKAMGLETCVTLGML